MNIQRSSIVLTLVMSIFITAPALAKKSLPEPEMVIRQMCDHLISLQQFTYKAKVTYDVVNPKGEKKQHSFAMKTNVRRPDQLQVDASGDVVNKEMFLNGASLTLYDKKAKAYAILDVPPNIEGALEKAQQEFNLQVTLADLASPKLYQHLSKGLKNARNLGIEEVREIPSYHLLFDHQNTQLHLWIDTGAKPLLRKVKISTNTTPQVSTWTALFGKWNVQPKLNEKVFTFVPPSDAQRIEFRPAQYGARQGQTRPVRDTRISPAYHHANSDPVPNTR